MLYVCREDGCFLLLDLGPDCIDITNCYTSNSMSIGPGNSASIGHMVLTSSTAIRRNSESIG